MALVTGERVVTSDGGFNPTWQRHVATYALCANLLPSRDPVLDLGCGVGHSFHYLHPRRTIGIDLNIGALRGQSRSTCVADMGQLPFRGGSFASVLSIQSIEHARDANCVLAEVARVLKTGGTAIFVTPNRLTFGRPNEIIDPYHFREFDPQELQALCVKFFSRVDILGVFGSTRFNELWAEQLATLNKMLRYDPLRVRRLIPRRLRQLLYDWQLTYQRRMAHNDVRHAAITPADFYIEDNDIERSFDLVAICS